MNRLKRLALVGALLLMSVAPARADFFISPCIGVVTGGIVLDGAKLSYCGQLGVVTDKAVGFEGDYGYTAKTRGGHGTDNFRTFGGAVLIAPPGFGSEKWRPYASIGGGLIGAVTKVQHIYLPTSEEVESAPVISVGGGLFGFLSSRIGVRVDARYFRAMLDDPDQEVSPNFIRASAGLVIRF